MVSQGKWVDDARVYEEYRLLEIKDGNVIKEHSLSPDEYKNFDEKRKEVLRQCQRKLYEKRVFELYKQSAPLREKKEDEEDFVEPTKDERALYMFEQEVKILNNRQENL